MIEEPPILTINQARRRPTPEQIAAFQGVPTGFVVDALEGDTRWLRLSSPWAKGAICHLPRRVRR